MAFLVGLAFAVAASANLPVILLTISWRGFTSTGAVTGMVVGLVSAVLLVALGPSTWSPEVGKAIFVGEPKFPLANPGLVSIPLGFIAAIVGSPVSKKSTPDPKFDEIVVRANLGPGAPPVTDEAVAAGR